MEDNVEMLYNIKDEKDKFDKICLIDSSINLKNEEDYLIAIKLISFCIYYERKSYIEKTLFLLYKKYKSMGFSKYDNVFKKCNMINYKTKQPRDFILKNIVKQIY